MEVNNEGDRTEVAEEEKIFTEEEETANNYKNDCGELGNSFLKIEGTLNCLFSDILKSKVQLHSVMDVLKGGIMQTIADKKQYKVTLEKRQQENIKLERKVEELGDKIRKLENYVSRLGENQLKYHQEKEQLLLENTKLKVDVEEEIKKNGYTSELKKKMEKFQQEKEILLLENTKLKKDLEDLRELKVNLVKSENENTEKKMKKSIEDQIRSVKSQNADNGVFKEKS